MERFFDLRNHDVQFTMQTYRSCRNATKGTSHKAQNRRCIRRTRNYVRYRYHCEFPHLFAICDVSFFFSLEKYNSPNRVPSQILHFLRSHGARYGLPPYFSHSRLNSCSRTSAPRFLVNPVSSKLSSHICISSIPATRSIGGLSG